MPASRTLTRMPVYDVANGRVVGRVHRLIVDPDTRKVVGLLLATRLGREARCLPFRNIHAIGAHAITVRGMDAIVRLADLPDMAEIYRSQRRIHHSPVLTEDGTFVGDVDEFTVNAQTGRIESLLVSGGLIHDLFRGQATLPAHFVLTIGEDATIVREQAVALLRQRQRMGTAAESDAADRVPNAPDDPSDQGVARPRGHRRWFGLFGRAKGPIDVEPTVTVPDTDGENLLEEDSTVVPQLRHQSGLEQHRAHHAQDVVPPVPADGREGGDSQL